MRINQNISALNAWRHMMINDSAMNKSLERLSSGLRINRAADDAAGLAVSEKMRAQVRGIMAAQRNTQDAVSLIQTAESAAGEVQNMIQRMRELAVQASSDTLSDTDRAKLDSEFQQLLAEVDRTTDTVTYNGRKLINGESGDKATASGTGISNAQVTSALKGAGSFSISVASLAREQKQVAVAKDDAGVPADVVWDTTSTLDELFDNAGVGGVFASGDTMTFSQSGKSITVDLNAVKGYTASQFITHVNDKAKDAGMAMRMAYSADTDGGGTDGLIIESNTDGTSGDVVVAESIAAAGVTFGFTDNSGADTVDQTATNASLTITNSNTGVALVANTDYTVDGNTITGVATKDLQGVKFTAAAASTGTLTLSQNGLTFQIGPNNGETIDASLADLTGNNLGISSLTLTTRGTAETAINTLDETLTTISEKRAEMGALQNRMEHTIENLSTQAENLTSAESRIRDADMAMEMARFVRNQILIQASTAMLSQANQKTQAVLQLLR